VYVIAYDVVCCYETETLEDVVIHITDYSETELKAELKHREDVKDHEAKIRRREKVKMIMYHKEPLMALMSHERGSCGSGGGNDYYHREHGGAMCALCCLESLNECDDIEITVDVTLCKVKKVLTG
jgi:hypothetical protein